MKKTLLLVFLSSLSAMLFAQATDFCATPVWSPQELAQLRAARMEHLRLAPQNAVQNNTLYIPMTIHIVGKTDGTGFVTQKFAFDALCQLNKDFVPANIQFYLKDSVRYVRNDDWYQHYDFNGGYALVNATQVPGTMNCYFVDIAAGACAYANYAWAVVLKNSCAGIGSHTWAHESGHYFSLPHTFVGWENISASFTQPAPPNVGGNDVELADSSNCATAADNFCDTPADYISYRWNCDANGQSATLLDPNGQGFKASGTYYMSYSNDGCMTQFSPDQMTAMRNFAMGNMLTTVTEYTSPNLQPTQSAITLLPIDHDTITTSTTAQLTWRRDPNATHYIIEMTRQASFIATQITKITTDTTFLVTNLLAGKNYYWKVRPFNALYTCMPPNPTIKHFVTRMVVGTQNATNVAAKLTIVPTITQRGQPITLTWTNLETPKAVLRILNTNGQILLEKTVYPNLQDDYDLDTAALPAGVLFVTLQAENTLLQQKIVLF
jgi:hypothetical protein